MPLRYRNSFALLLCLGIAACSGEAPPPPKDSAAAEPTAAASDKAIASSSVRDPRTSMAAARPPQPSPTRDFDNDRPGDMPKMRPLGSVECDQFAEKVRQCINSGALSPENRQALRSEYVGSINAMRFKVSSSSELGKACTDLQQKLQPRFVDAGCRNM